MPRPGTRAALEDQRDKAIPAGKENFSVLVVDDEQLFAKTLAAEIRSRGIECDIAFRGEDAIARAERKRYHMALVDHRLPDADGIELIPLLLAHMPRCTIVVVTAYEALENAVRAIRLGAEDYTVKEASLDGLLEMVEQARRRHEVRAAGKGWDEHRRDGLCGNSAAIQKVREQLQMVATHEQTPVLLTGETGVGKEVAARYLHQLSCGPSKPFVSLDCIALPSGLAESIMFGHEKGAFTGAVQSSVGIFEEAADGTILLDEIGDMDLAMQGKLLRVLENRSFCRVGSTRPCVMRARVVAATNRNLEQMVEDGLFRNDLYQRLSVFPIHIPPLRQRGTDVLVLAQHFAEFFARKMQKPCKSLSAHVQQLLMEYDFPGNVRELKNMIERAVILCNSNEIQAQHLPQRILTRHICIPAGRDGDQGGLQNTIQFVPGMDSLESLEKKLILFALRHAGNNRTEAARLLGISRFQLLRRMRKHDLIDTAE